MTNNALKRKHLPKKTRHWKCMWKFILSDAEIKYALQDEKVLSQLLKRIENELVDRFTEHMNQCRPEWWKL